jgi:hypothetical protein
MNDEVALLEKLERLPANRGQVKARLIPKSAREDLQRRVERLPPVYTEEEKKDRAARFARFIARAVRRGAMPPGFATTLLNKLMPNEHKPARTIQLPDLPRITDATSYRLALEVIAAAAAEGRVTVQEARDLAQIIKATWAALRAERRERR